jgi:hypothetical protein
MSLYIGVNKREIIRVEDDQSLNSMYKVVGNHVFLVICYITEYFHADFQVVMNVIGSESVLFSPPLTLPLLWNIVEWRTINWLVYSNLRSST